MKRQYDFSKGVRGAVVPAAPGKTRITIRIDNRVLEWFRSQVNASGGGNYQTLMNDALKRHIDTQSNSMEQMVRRVVREELSRPRKASPRSTKSDTTKIGRQLS